MDYESGKILCRRCLAGPADEKRLAEYLDEYAATLPEAIRAEASVYRARLLACAACAKRLGFTCLLCGCYVQARAAKKAQRCPLPNGGRWKKEEDIMEAREKIAALAGKLIAGCRVRATDGTTLYTPDVTGFYGALWTRDFAYMCEYAGACVPDADLAAAVDYLARHARADGWLPDRVYANGHADYAAGATDHPVGEANLDNAPFFALLVDMALRRPSGAERGRVGDWLEAAYRGYAALPVGEHGLIYNSPERPHSPYGFTDTVGKTGELFLESLLAWRGARAMEKWDARRADWYAAFAAKIEAGIDCLLDADSGVYFAAGADCRQIDIWGNAYALCVGFPLAEARQAHIADYLAEHYEEIVYRGQVRHLPAGEYWQRMLLDVPKGEYQNGAYWATAGGWMAKALRGRHPELAARTVAEAADYFEECGIYECVNGDYRKLRDYVVSATNLLL